MNTVAKINNYSVYDDIISFLNLAHYSDNTKIGYERGIRDFFLDCKGKDIEHLRQNELNIIKKDIESFRTKLKNNGYSNNTINHKVAGIRRLYKEFKANGYDVDITFFDVIKKLPEDTNSYDPFTLDEVLQMHDLVLKERQKGEAKAKFLLFAVDTCIRKSALLNLKWSDLHVVDEEEVRIIAVDKGNKDFRAMIHYDFYKELLSLKTDSEYVFDITLDMVNKMIPRLVKKLNVDPERNLTFHSLRKTGIEFKYRYTGDIKVAQKAACHEDFSLTFNTYVSTEEYGVLGAISLQHKSDESVLDKLNLEQLKGLIGELDSDIVLRMEKKAKELYKGVN